MKRIATLFCLALTVAPLAFAPMAAQAGGLRLDSGGLKVGAVLSAVLDVSDQDRRRRRDNGDDNNQQQQQPNRDDRRDDRRDNRSGDGMARAYALASRYGRVIDVWPEGGSIFGASVSNNRGKVELRIDVDSGRVEER